MDIADKIKFLREEVLELSTVHFAKKLNVSRITIYNWETGICTPSLSHIITIARLSNVSLDYIIHDHEQYNLNPINLDDEGYEILERLISYFEKRNTTNDENRN